MNAQNDREVIQWLWDYGHFRNPDYPTAINVREVDLPKLTVDHPVVKQAIASIQTLDANANNLVMALHGRPLEPDGEIGPATRDLLELPRCGQRDYDYAMDVGEVEALGTGNWKNCHDVGNFHCAAVKILNNPPAFLAPHFAETLRRVQQAYAETGLLFKHYMPGEPVPSPYQIDFSFVNSSGGWIGLATIGSGRTCTSSPIYCKYLSTYKGGSTFEDWINQWTTLIKHEHGHNCGTGHTSGGVMNPSIRNGLPISWRTDILWNWLAKQFGGVAVPIPGKTWGGGEWL